MPIEKLTDEEIREKVLCIISGQLGIEKEKVTRNAHFVYDLGADSLDWVELIISITDAFGIDTPSDKTAKKICNLQQAVDFVKQKIAT